MQFRCLLGVASLAAFHLSAATTLAQASGVPTLSIALAASRVQFVASELEVGKQSVVQFSTNLVDWMEILSLKPTTSTFNWSDTKQGAAGFYRLIQDPGPQKLVAASIYQVMKGNAIQGLSITVVTNGGLAWAQGFGRLAKGRPELVDTNTLFQAASISKPASALAALRMVEQGLLSLDEPVNNKLTTLLIPGKNGASVTLRHILSHTGGIPDGVAFYDVGSPIPTLLQILKGQPPSRTGRIVASDPLGVPAYSNAGYTFLQALMIDVSGKAFPDLLRELVFEPLEMHSSTFEQPLPEDLQSNAACGHVGGAVIKGNWYVLPQMAPAGLWTTPSDLARMFIAVRSAYLAEAGSLIRQDTAREMLRLHAAAIFGRPYGLGFGLVLKDGAAVGFGHLGSLPGYVCGALTFVESGDGVVIMTNSDPSIISNVYNSCATAYGWPGGLL